MAIHSTRKVEQMLRVERRRPGGNVYVALKLVSCAIIMLAIVLPATTIVGQNDAASITASPNPVPSTAGSGTTRIAWETRDNQITQVYVSVDGTSEKLFASGRSGSQDAPWIAAGSNYEFRLYAGTEHSQLLGTVIVTQSTEPSAASKKYTPVTGLPLSPETLVFLALGGYVLLILGAYYFWERWRGSKMVKAQSELSVEDESVFQEHKSESQSLDKSV